MERKHRFHPTQALEINFFSPIEKQIPIASVSKQWRNVTATCKNIAPWKITFSPHVSHSLSTPRSAAGGLARDKKHNKGSDATRAITILKSLGSHRERCDNSIGPSVCPSQKAKWPLKHAGGARGEKDGCGRRRNV